MTSPKPFADIFFSDKLDPDVFSSLSLTDEERSWKWSNKMSGAFRRGVAPGQSMHEAGRLDFSARVNADCAS